MRAIYMKSLNIFKGGSTGTHFTMCIFHFQVIDFVLWNAFCEVSPKGTFCLLSRGKQKYATLGMRLWWKYINYLLVILVSHQTVEEPEAAISWLAWVLSIQNLSKPILPLADIHITWQNNLKFKIAIFTFSLKLTNP